jgi:hypothetical protein
MAVGLEQLQQELARERRLEPQRLGIAQLQAVAALTISTGPQWNRNRQIAQYVTTITDATATTHFGGRYVFGELQQSQLTMTTRVSVIVTPKVSMQVFAQPLIAVGDYGDFKELARPRSYDFLHYGAHGRSIAYDRLTRSYAVDPDGAGAAPGFSFSDPDFNFKSLRLNAVFRWEVKPGSALYAVWTRQQVDHPTPACLRPAATRGPCSARAATTSSW